jgi:hypothetical protein
MQWEQQSDPFWDIHGAFFKQFPEKLRILA